MKALVLTSTEGNVEFREADEPTVGPGTTLVSLHAAALNRRDYWITQGLYPGIRAPCILGSDGAGVVQAVGEGVDDSWIGREVIINPGIDWGPRPEVQGESFRILGMPDHGTFAPRIAVPAEQLAAKPSHLSLVEAAALPLAGLTAFRALFSQGNLQAGQTVLITGIGGGVAVMALKMASSLGARTLVTSSSQEKIDRAVSLGGAAGANYTDENWTRELAGQGPVDLVVDGAAGPGFNDLLDCVRPGGRIVNYGGTAGPPPRFDIRKHFWKQLHLTGSTMGSPGDFEAMVDYLERHRIRPEVDSVSPLSRGTEAMASMADSPQFGKLVLEIG
ncbi:MAG: zinc-binding dehydrogenase [Akkermansiaceae bacterium]|nr:zinc-binding dehydrogenase [Akkermansiaceae bacterium]